jgi:hypothetical protein
MSAEPSKAIRTGQHMKRVARTVIVSAVLIGAVTGALAVAEAGRYPGAKQIPTVLTSQRASTTATTAPEIAVAAPAPAPAAAPAAPTPKASSKHKSSSGSTSRRSATPKKAAPAPAPAPAPKRTESSHSSSREVVNHGVRDESSEHSSSSGTSSDHSKPSSGDSTQH